LTHDAGVQPSGGKHCELSVHAAQPFGVQYGVAPEQAGWPLQLQPPPLQMLVFPVHCELPVHVVQPVVSQVWPALQAWLPLQLHVPFVHVLVAPMQSLDVQQPVDATHVPLAHIFSPEAQAHPLLGLQVCPVPHALFPLQVQTPIVQVSVVPVQSASVQHCDSGMHVPAHVFDPAGH
jgi:hypothetical protein